MIEVRLFFAQREQEINLYFDFLEKTITYEADLHFKDNVIERLPVALFPTLRANTILMLYNMMEAVMRQCIDAIHITISDKNNPISYQEAIPLIQKIWIEYKYNNFQKNDDSTIIWNILQNIANDTIDIVDAEDAEQKYLAKVKGTDISGGVDLRKAKILANKYGWADITVTSGAKAVVVKRHRNLLAHGRLSFNECGNEFQLSDLQDIKQDIFLFLTQVIDAIDDYLSQQCYKR